MDTPIQLTPMKNDTIDHRVTNGWTVVRVTGEIDVCSSAPLRDDVGRLIDAGHRHMVLDLREVTFLDSMGLSAIVAITKRLRARAGSLLLTCTDSRILDVFKAGGLYDVYAFHPSATEATRRAPNGSGLAGWPNSPC